MRSLTKYILKQAAAPLIFFTLVLTVIVWLTQSLQMLDLVINRNQSGGTYLMMTLYVLPSLLTIIIPFALFCASLFVLQRLASDSELLVMWSSGISPWVAARPLLILGLIATVITLLLNLYLMPAGYRTMKDKVYEIRADIASSMIRDGQFTNPSSGLTVYNRETTGNGELHNLLIHDNRDRERPTTYLAELGKFVTTPEGPRLVMLNGNSQSIDASGNLSVLYFERYTLDISQFTGPREQVVRELSERYLHELLHPNISSSWERNNLSRLAAEGHDRLATPLYNISFVMIALCTFMMGGFSRRGYTSRVIIALVIGLFIRLVGFGLKSVSAQNPGLEIYQYLLPIFVIFSCAYILFEVKRWIRRQLKSVLPDFGSDWQAVR